VEPRAGLEGFGDMKIFVTTGLRNPNRIARRRLHTVYVISTSEPVT
jgi:hypothetical protein